MKSRAQLESLTDSLMEAWNAHDARALCALYASDADFVGENGAMIRGRDAIFAQYERWFATTFARSSLTLNALKVRVLTPGAALLHVVWSMRGHCAHGTEWLPVRTGTLLLVCTCRRGKWEFVLVHCASTPAFTPA